MTSKEWSIKGHCGRLDFIEIEHICSTKNSYEMKRQGTVHENIFAEHTSDRILISKIYIYTELSKLKNNPIQK